MASCTKLPLFLLLTTLIFSPLTRARDSQFFSKVARNRDPVTTTTTSSYYDPNTNTYNALKDNEFSTVTKLEENQVEENEPVFVPETTGTGYGLYGHETGLDAPSTAPSTKMRNNAYEKHNNYYNNEMNEKNYAPELKGLNEFTTTTTPTTTSLYSMDNNAYEKHNNYYNNNNEYEKNYAPEFKSSNNNNNNYYYNSNYKKDHVEEGKNNHYGHGMSDTRYMENGKYYFDITDEGNHGAIYKAYTNNHNGNYNGNYKNNGYYGNEENNYEEFYNNRNDMQGYKNQIPDEEEFDFDP